MSSPLREFVERAHAAGITIHTLEVGVEGRTVARQEIAPFGTEIPHRMYSVSKSITALAVLLLVEEDRLRLDAPIVTYFPEMEPTSPWLAATRIDDMLAMTGPHSRTTFDDTGEWLASYFRRPPTHRPASQFVYDTSASYTLAALVERCGGAPLLEYLRPRVLEPLGIGAGARFLAGPDGFSHGGSGLIAAPHDLVRLAEVINGAGSCRGVRVLPERVVRRLLELRSDPGMQAWGAPFRAGYGRHVWLPRAGAWMMFGLGGQIVYGEPERSLVAVVTADATPITGGDQRLVEMLLTALSHDQLDDPGALDMPLGAHDPAHARSLSGAFTVITGDGAPDRVALTVDSAGGEVRIGGNAPLRFSTGGRTVTDGALGRGVIAARWSRPGVLELLLSAASDDISSVHMRIVVSDDDIVTVQSHGSGPEIGAAWTWVGSYRPAGSGRPVSSPWLDNAS
ncbi:beta-lactamase family protein [Microbacterium sp. LMI12-1-1.1]|uniref:serine hydrolase domain-containing protein n=1 Tax=Microbacterium sp. LMI12-1-1.1 TaxID=3135225 RepID=UPI0034169FA0